jgi:ribonuclease HI
MINVWTDGAIYGGQGGRGIGAFIIKNSNGMLIAKDTVDLGPEINTSNRSEYVAVKAALAKLIELKLTEECITLHSDSQLVLNQITDEWACNDPYLSKIRDDIWILMEDFDSLSFEWVSRDLNTEADLLSKSLKELR